MTISTETKSAIRDAVVDVAAIAFFLVLVLTHYIGAREGCAYAMVVVGSKLSLSAIVARLRASSPEVERVLAEASAEPGAPAPAVAVAEAPPKIPTSGVLLLLLGVLHLASRVGAAMKGA